MGSSESLVLMDGEQPNITVNREEFVQDVEDPWWWEIENQDLVLNVVSDEIVNSNPSTSAVALARNRRSRALNVNSDNNVINDNKRQNPTLQDTAASPSKLDPPIVTIKNKEQLESEIESTLKKEQTLEEFKEELKAKRMARQTAVNDLREEIQSLRRQLAEERDTTRRLQENKSVVENEDPDTAAEYRKKLLEESDRVLAQQIADDDVVAGSSNPKVQLAEAQLALQLANADNLSLTTELGVTRKQVISLKEVVTCCKQMITVREEEVTQLKGKLQEIEESLVERELRLMSDNLRQEYDRQLANMRTLRQLYEERARVSAAERDNLQRQISMKKDELAAEKEKIKTVEESNANLEIELASTNEELIALKEQCSEYRFENKTLKEEMGAINKLFSQMLMGFNGTNNLDIDGLTMMLEENRTLLNDMATKEANSDCATLPKLLFELVQQVTATNKQEDEKEIQEGPDCDKITSNPLSPPVMLEESSSVAISTSKPIVCGEPTMGTDISLDENAEVATEKMNSKYNDEVSVLSLSANHQPNFDHYSSKVTATVASAEEIIGNLPKVWKVLMELLSHHKIERVQFKENGEGEDCFKSIETPNGPKAELSVSKTYIKLKDLILEKKSLVKETNRLKTLNCHLEFRLNEQQKRLSAVSLELQKTWHLVGKMQRQHRQLHTQEQILRYQLQQKRRLLYELKDELEYCRRKWAAAKAKTEESQLQCEDLRREFAKRKLQDNNNSAESGYSDGPVSDEDETTIGAKSTQMSKDWMPLFELRKPIKRTLSASPETERYYEDIALRRHSAPPSIYEPSENNLYLTADEQDLSSNGVESSRLYTQSNSDRVVAEEDCEDNSRSLQDDRASRIQKLEEQCKSLIAAVIQTSDNRERLEIQLCRFQDEISPPQYAVPLEEYLASTVKDGLQKLPSAIDSQKERSEEGCLTDREEEYTRKRSERLNRLEEESRQLMCRIKKTSDKGNSLRSSLERIHSRRAVSREGSFESNTEEVEESTQTLQEKPVREEELRILTEKEEEYSAKRAQRLQRLEEESKLLMSKLVKNSERGTTFNSKLDALRERYGSDEKDDSQGFRSVGNNLEDISKRLDVLEEETCQLVDKASHPSLHGSGTVNEHQTHQEKQNDSEPVSILPTPESVACSSIVSEEISERVIITRTPSQIAQSSGAVPKIIKSSQITTNSKTTSNDNKSQKLCASTGRKRIQNIKKDPASETLEEMVVRLRNLPFPTNSKGNEKCEDPTNHQKQ